MLCIDHNPCCFRGKNGQCRILKEAPADPCVFRKEDKDKPKQVERKQKKEMPFFYKWPYVG